MRLIYALFFLLLILPYVHAEQVTIPPVKQGSCVFLTQLELNSSYQNLTAVQYPNKTVLLLGANMTKYGYYYTYNFCNTSLLGEYVVNGCSDLSCWAYDFEVNPTGAQTSTFQGLLYALFLFILMGLFGLFLYGSFAIPSENVESPEGTLLKINWKKYARWMCFVFTWLIGLWISFVCWNLSYAFAFFSTMEDIFEVIFTTYSAVSLVVIPVFVIYMVVQAVQDWKINEMIERNLTVRL